MLNRMLASALAGAVLVSAAGCGGADKPADADPAPAAPLLSQPYAEGGAVRLYRECLVEKAGDSAYREILADTALNESLRECRPKRLLAIEAAAEDAIGRIRNNAISPNAFAVDIVDNIELLALDDQYAAIRGVHDLSEDSLPLRYRVCLLEQVRSLREETNTNLAVVAAFKLCRKIRTALLIDASMHVAREQRDVDPYALIMDVDNDMRKVMIETHMGERP